MSRANKKEFRRMVDAWIKGEATKEEQTIIFKYFDLFSNGTDFFDLQSEHEIKDIRNRLKLMIDLRIEKQTKKIFKIHYKYISVAASIVFISISSVLYFKYHSGMGVKQKAVVYNDIVPGSSKAVLILSDGSKVELSENENTKIDKELGIKIYKQTGQVLFYQRRGNVREKLAFNTIETPRGGQYKMILSDGTKVWLNAASSLHFPVVFGDTERRVDLIGEAYFEVTKNKARPFKVITNKQNVEVLGTHFNINAYTDGSTIKTTLLEGKIIVGFSNTIIKKTLLPGDQSSLNFVTKNIDIKKVDTDAATAWKNGYFIFDNEPIEDVLKEVARWYDVEVEFQNQSIKKTSFNGTLSKYGNLSKVLSKLQLAGHVKFKVEGRTIIVY